MQASWVNLKKEPKYAAVKVKPLSEAPLVFLNKFLYYHEKVLASNNLLLGFSEFHLMIFCVKFCETNRIILIQFLKWFDPIIYGVLGVFCSKTNQCNLHSIDKIKGINQNKLAQKTGLNHNSSYHIGGDIWRNLDTECHVWSFILK